MMAWLICTFEMEMACYLIGYEMGNPELYELLIVHDICIMGDSWLVGGTSLKYG